MIYTLGLKNLPFVQDEHDIIYVENSYDELMNQFIQEHYDAICECFQKRGCRFVYMPRLVEELSQKGVVQYYAPSVTHVEDSSLSSDWILDFMVYPKNREKIQPSLLVYRPYFFNWDYEEAEEQYHGIQIYDYDYAEDGDFSLVIDKLLYKKPGSGIHYQKVPEEDGVLFRDGDDERREPESADENFDWESKLLIREVEERISKLKQMGISAAILERLLHKDEELSRLLITKDYDIFLPDYQNMEIKMTPLPKAVYVLFLRHPEGIMFSHLPDYRQEIYEIYSKLKGGNITPRIRKSIDDVTDPLNNSINEKCARIREAFISQFDEHLAKYYYIDGKRGEAKKVMLPQELVVWE